MTDEARLQRWIATRGNGPDRGRGPSDHVDMEALDAYARRDLPPPLARSVDEHLAVCDDGRCAAYVEDQGGVVSQKPASTMMNGEPARARTFQSRETIWNTFESMAGELDMPIDELVNVAMETYARVRGYKVPGPSEARRPSPPPQKLFEHRRDPMEETQDAGMVISALDRSYAPARAPEDLDEDDLARTSTRGAFARKAPRGAAPADPLMEGDETRTAPRMRVPVGRPPAPAPATQRLPPGPGPDPTKIPKVIEPYAARPPPLPAPPPRSMAPMTMPMPHAPSMPRVQERRLVLSYQGRQHSVDKDRFLIGRSKTQADLRLDDPNVSRQHAVIEKVGSAFYLVDLGSTNGVHIGGERIARRAVADGDVITITSHEILVAFR